MIDIQTVARSSLDKINSSTFISIFPEEILRYFRSEIVDKIHDEYHDSFPKYIIDRLFEEIISSTPSEVLGWNDVLEHKLVGESQVIRKFIFDDTTFIVKKCRLQSEVAIFGFSNNSRIRKFLLNPVVSDSWFTDVKVPIDGEMVRVQKFDKVSWRDMKNHSMVILTLADILKAEGV